VSKVLEQTRPRCVLDIGCNDGEFSVLAARHGAAVVAIDADAAVVDTLARRVQSERLTIVPLVVDFARPTPAIGWRNVEFPSFLDRTRGGFDLVMMLAILHHLIIDARAPLEDVVALASEMTRETAILEFVSPADPMFAAVARGRESLFASLTVDAFEQALHRRFEIVDSLRLPASDRWLYALRRR
jgi:SAM-dependent methyltransferase